LLYRFISTTILTGSQAQELPGSEPGLVEGTMLLFRHCLGTCGEMQG